MDESAQEFLKFKEIIARLRDPNGGCPWDLAQSHESLKPHLLEESYEVLEAIDTDLKKLPGELGDLLLQIFLHCQIASESGEFDLTDVIRGVSTKMVARHPHVFGDTVAKTAAEVKENWERIKKSSLNSSESVLDSIPNHLPALAKAQRMGEKAAALGFDWRSSDDVKEKIREEVNEYIESNSKPNDTEELGDLLFALTQFARKSGINAEDALNQACRKFKNRFKFVEAKAGPDIKKIPLETLEQYWNESKRQG